MLLLAWRMGASRMGYFSREEFVRGLRALGTPTLDKLRKALPKLESDMESDPDAFSSFFAFAFKFCLTVRGSSPWFELLCSSDLQADGG